MNFLAAPFRLIWKHRYLLVLTTRSDLRTRYAGTLLGWAWVAVYPLLFLGIYSLYYIYIVGPRGGQPGPSAPASQKVAMIFCGLLPFLGFAEALSIGVGSVINNASLIKNTLYPIELIPVKAVLTSQCTQVVGSALLLVALGIMGKLTVWALLLPVAWLAQVLLAIGVVWVFSSVNVYLRDFQSMVGMLLMMLMLVSPIGLDPESVPRALRLLLQLNPLYYVIVSYQDCLLFARFPAHGVFWIMLLLGVLAFLLGHWFFSRMKKAFVDNV